MFIWILLLCLLLLGGCSYISIEYSEQLAILYEDIVIWFKQQKNKITKWIKKNKKKTIGGIVAVSMASAGVMLLPMGDEAEPLPQPFLYEEFIAPEHSFGMGDTTFKTVNWSYFKQLFNAHCDWIIEYKRYSTSSWTNGNQYMTIEKSWNETLSGWKFNLILDVPVDVYSARFTFGCDLVVLDYVERDGWQVNINYTIPNTDEVYNVFFNWSDMANIPNIVFTKGVLDDVFWFRFRRDNIPSGHYEFDPTFGWDNSASNLLFMADSYLPTTYYLLGQTGTPESDGYAYNITVWFRTQSFSTPLKYTCALYEKDGAIDAGTLVGTTEELTIDSTGKKIFNFVSPPLIYSSKSYFLCITPTSTSVFYGTDKIGGNTGSDDYDTITKTSTSLISLSDPLTGESDFSSDVYIFCSYIAESPNIAPTQSGESPTNTSTDIAVTPSLYVICLDDDADNMNATWHSNSSGAWVQFASNTSIANNTNITQSNSNFSAYSTTYYWSVNLTDDNGGWDNDTYYFTTEAKIYNTTIRNDGEDYFVWLGTNTTAYYVGLNITGFDEADDNISIWRNGTWGGSNVANWVTFHGDDSGTNFSIYTFDVVRVVLTDSGTQTLNMTANTNIDYDASRNYTWSNSSVNKGYNYTGKNTVGSTTLSAINTSVGLEAKEMLAVWNRTTFTWNIWLVEWYETDATVARWAILTSKVEDNEYWVT